MSSESNTTVADEVLTVSTETTVQSHVLVVDDDPAGCRLIEARLKANGHRVTTCNDSRRAQQLALQHRPDLIVSDVCMPGLNGIEFTRWTRTQTDIADTPVLLVTSHDDFELLSRGLDAGADDFLTKPIDPVELRARMHVLVRQQVTVRTHTFATSAEDSSRSEQSAGHERVSAPDNEESEATPASPTILFIEDDQQQCHLLETYLAGLPCTAHICNSGSDALGWLDKNSADLIVCDLMLPDIDGYQVIEGIRANPKFANTPLLAISVLSDVEDRVKALNLGADDFVLKGFCRLEFQARVRRLLKMKSTIDDLQTRWHEAAQRAVTDSLTGLVTHGYISETLSHDLQLARRANESHSVIFVDVDHFKTFNDKYGHALGDEVLKRVADVISKAIRSADTAARFGGEEFVISLPKTNSDDARGVAERIRTSVEDMEIAVDSDGETRNIRVTASVGLATFPEDAHDVETLLQHADEAMYSAKQAGRNTVITFSANGSAGIANHRVLVVDDEPPNVRLISAILASDRYEILTAENGAEALEIARHSNPDVILMDAMMPRMTGFDACRRLKNEASTRLIPVVLVTALTGRENKLKSIEAGADAFITKPVDKDELRTQVKAFLKNKRTTDSLENAETVIYTLARAVEGRDSSTGGHVERVSHYAVELGRAIGLSEGEINGLRSAGIVHDIGKISIPDAVLLKPGKLDEHEREIIERHVELGYELLKPLRTFDDALPVVRFHHERLDGSGYPMGLKGDDIPITAQVLAIVDVYDALITDRVYRKAFSKEKTIAILREEAERGLHNPELVETFIRLIDQL